MLNWIKIIYLNISKVIKFKETGVRNEDIKIYIIRELKKLLYVMYIIREKWLNINKKVLENYVYKVWNINKKNKLNWYKNIGYNYNKNEEINKNMKSKLVSNLLESLLTGIIIKKDSLGINNGVNKKYRNKLKNIKVKKLSIFISKPVIRERIKEIEINFYYYLPSYRFRKFYKRIENGLELLRKRNTNYKIKWNLKKELNNLVDNNKWKKIRILKLIKKVSNRKNIKEIWIKDNKNYTNNYLTSNLMNNIMLDILNIKKMNKYLNGIFKTKRIINQKNKIKNLILLNLNKIENEKIESINKNELKNLNILKWNINKKLSLLNNINNDKKVLKRILIIKLKEIDLRIRKLNINNEKLRENNEKLLKSGNIRLRFKKLSYLNKYLIIKIQNNSNISKEISKNIDLEKLELTRNLIIKNKNIRKLKSVKRKLYLRFWLLNKSNIFTLKRRFKLKLRNNDYVLYNNKLSMYYVTILNNYNLVKKLSNNKNIRMYNNKLININILENNNNNNNKNINILNILNSNEEGVINVYKNILKNKETGSYKIFNMLRTFNYNAKNNWWKIKKASFYYYYNLGSLRNRGNKSRIQVSKYKFINIINRFREFKKNHSIYWLRGVNKTKRLHNKRWFKKLSLRLKRQKKLIGVQDWDMKISNVKFDKNKFSNYLFNNNDLNICNYSKIFTYFFYNEEILVPKQKSRVPMWEINKENKEWKREQALLKKKQYLIMENKNRLVYKNFAKKFEKLSIDLNKNIERRLENYRKTKKSVGVLSNNNNINKNIVRNYHTSVNKVLNKEIRGIKIENKNMNNINKNIERKEIYIRNINLLLKRNRKNNEIKLSKLENRNNISILNNINLNIDQVFNKIGVLKENNEVININNEILKLSNIIKDIYNKKVVIKGMPLKYEYNNNEILLKLIKKGINKRYKNISRKLRFKLIKRIKLVSRNRLKSIWKRERNTENLFLYKNKNVINILKPKNKVELVKKLTSKHVLGFMLRLKGKLGRKKGKVRKSKQLIRQGSMAYRLNDNYILNSQKGNMLKLTNSTQVKEGRIGVMLNISYL